MPELVFFGHACFRIRGREAIIVTDPFDRSLGYSLGRLTANIVTVSHHHPHHDNVGGVGGNPRVVDGPGEYEIAEVSISGVATHRDRPAQEGARPPARNTAYLIELEDVTFCHLGSIAAVPSAASVEALTPVDVLLAPVGGGGALDAAAAAAAVALLAPKIVVPMRYQTPTGGTELEPVERFLREMGLREVAPAPRLSVSRSSLPPETQVVLLDYRR